MACLDCARLGRLSAMNCQHDPPTGAARVSRLRARLRAVADEVGGELNTIYHQAADAAERREIRRRPRLDELWPTRKESNWGNRP